MSRKLAALFLIMGVHMLIGCASAQKDYDYMSNNDYQRRSKLSQSLISGNEPMSETAVQKILSSKVALPKNWIAPF
jgi:hypothetical protein